MRTPNLEHILDHSILKPYFDILSEYGFYTVLILS